MPYLPEGPEAAYGGQAQAREGEALSLPSPTDRLAKYLEHLPDACRAVLAALDRARARGGGEVTIRLEVGRDGVDAIELPARYQRRRDP